MTIRVTRRAPRVSGEAVSTRMRDGYFPGAEAGRNA